MNESIESRIEAAERRLRTMKYMAGALVLGMVALAGEAVLAPRSKRIVEAESFVVRDRSGHIRAEFGATHGGNPSLVLRDTKGRKQAVLETRGDDQASLMFLDRGIPRLELDSEGDGASSIRMQGRDETSRVELGMTSGGKAGLELSRDRDGLRLDVGPGLPAGLILTDAEGREIGSLGRPKTIPAVATPAQTVAPLGY